RINSDKDDPAVRIRIPFPYIKRAISHFITIANRFQQKGNSYGQCEEFPKECDKRIRVYTCRGQYLFLANFSQEQVWLFGRRPENNTRGFIEPIFSLYATDC